ncbi:MBL fold metallo-hydrolase [Rhodobacteraceae bacterium WD3A24]|nr:MBL fold metallo-hydrolase [Rhodobacteraceae bacterium WD3A24]
MSAPLMEEIRPHIRRFRWGEADVVTVLDGANVLDAVKPPFCMDKSDEEIAAIAAQARISAERVEHHFVPTLVNTGKELVLFDVGFGEAGRTGTTGRLRERLAEAGYRPEDVDVVAFTHCHPDHIQGVMEGDRLAFPNARHVIGRREFDEWNSGANIPQRREGNRELFLKLIAPLADRLTFLEDGDQIAGGITAEAGFGHSLGHMMYRMESGGRQLLIWGDIANHYVYSLRHPESTVAFDDDPAAATATRKRVLDMVATDGIFVTGHHMPFPSVGHVERQDGAYRWIPMTYQSRV